MKNHSKLLLALLLGLVLGLLSHSIRDQAFLQFLSVNVFATIGKIFLRTIFMVVVPMVVSALILGIFELTSSQGLGKIALTTLKFTLISSALSVLVGISLVNIVKPGNLTSLSNVGANIEATGGSVEDIKAKAGAAKSFSETITTLIPDNPLRSALNALEGEMLSLMIFALIFGLAFGVTSREKNYSSNGLLSVIEQVYATSMKIVEFAMKLAPLAVFSLVFNSAFKFGHSVFISLFAYICVVVAGLLIQQFGVYSILLKTFTRWSPREFFKQCREVYLYAFSTASSNATLPKSLSIAEHQLKLSKKISRFVLTIGSTANQNGTALFEGVTVLFLAQLYGVDLSVGQQFQVVLMSILAGIGTAGVPGGSLPLIMILLNQVGVPAEGLGLILGVDRFLDMCRTTINVSGDLVIAAIVDERSKI